MILLTITWESNMISQNIWKRVVGNVRINNSPSNISANMPLSERFHQNYQAVLVPASINGLKGPPWTRPVPAQLSLPLTCQIWHPQKHPQVSTTSGTYTPRQLSNSRVSTTLSDVCLLLMFKHRPTRPFRHVRPTKHPRRLSLVGSRCRVQNFQKSLKSTLPPNLNISPSGPGRELQVY